MSFHVLPQILGHRTLAHIRFDRRGFASSFVQAEPGHSTPASAQIVPLDTGGLLRVVLVPPAGSNADGFAVRVVASAVDLLPQVELPGFTRAILATGVTEDRVTREGRDIIAGLMPQEWTQTTDSSGFAQFKCLPRETPLELIVETHSGQLYVQRRFALTRRGEVEELRIELQSLGAAHGRLMLASGQPVRDRVMVAIKAKSLGRSMILSDRPAFVARSQTSTDGSFEIASLVPGDYFVGPKLDQDDPFRGKVVPSCGQRVVVLGGESTDMGTLRASPSSVLRGVVVDEMGALVPGASVLATANGEDGYLSTRSGQNGSFELGPLFAGSYGLHASSAKGIGWVAVDLDGESPSVCTVVLEILGGLHAVPGKDASGAGRIITRARLGGESGLIWAYRGADSEFTFGSIPPGGYELWTEFGDGSVARQERIEVRRGAPTIELALRSEPSAVLVAWNASSSRSLELNVLSGARCLMIRETLAPRKRITYRLPVGTIHVRAMAGETVIEERSLDLGSSTATEFRFGE